MKRAPIRILIVIIFTGIVCVIGELLLSHELGKLRNQHDKIMDEYVENREYMATIKTLMYEHQAVLVNHLLSENEEAISEYENQESNLRGRLTQLIIDFSYRMKGGKREQLYHKVYSDFAGYKNNADTLLDFSADGDNDMAIYYNDNILKTFLTDIDTNLDAIDNMTIDEINDAEKEMQDIISNAEILRNVIIIIMTGLIIICTVICVKIASNLDKYKINLEKELEEKNKSLRERDEKLIRLQDGIIVGMANLIESRNGETGEHVKRTSKYVEMIAIECRKKGMHKDILSDEYIDRLKKAAPLHDVGKICVSDAILTKPGKLTEEEFAEIKLHSSRGGSIIKECFESIEDKEYVDMAIDVASYHHEKWNGEGYSTGLKGEDIPLSARIMAIADVFDALVSKRCYKKALPVDDAYKIIEESSGTHFDPELVKVFVDIRNEVEEYLKNS